MPPEDPEQARWFAEEVLPHESALRAYLCGRFQALASADIDDLVQECYARLLRARATGPIACTKAFLFVVGRNFAFNYLRRRGHSHACAFTETDLCGVVDERVDVSESVAHTEELTLLIQAIQSLPDRCRQIVTLRKIYGLSQREVALRLGITENTVETQGSVGLRKCMEHFRRHGYGRRQ